MNLFRRVFDFMKRFGQSTPEPFEPTEPPESVIRQRNAWQLEEVLELIAASYDVSKDQLESEASGLISIIRWAKVNVKLDEYADANADIRYVAYGNDIAAGIDSREIDAEVCRSNDSKSPPSEPGAKVAKGEAYSPPAIAAILREQGWKRRAA